MFGRCLEVVLSGTIRIWLWRVPLFFPGKEQKSTHFLRVRNSSRKVPGRKVRNSKLARCWISSPSLPDSMTGLESMIKKIPYNSSFTFKILGQSFFVPQMKTEDVTIYAIYWLFTCAQLEGTFLHYFHHIKIYNGKDRFYYEIFLSVMLIQICIFLNPHLAAGLDLFQGDILLQVSICWWHSNIPQDWLSHCTVSLYSVYSPGMGTVEEVKESNP